MSDLVYKPNAIVSITKEFTFDSCHYLKEYEGKCQNYHGHTYKLQVTVKGKCDYRGMLIDFGDLKTIVKDEIIEYLDHNDLTKQLSFNTTAENMIVWIFDCLKANLPSEVTLDEVKLWETPTSFATYRG